MVKINEPPAPDNLTCQVSMVSQTPLLVLNLIGLDVLLCNKFSPYCCVMCVTCCLLRAQN
jgi:hypothetical protein